MSKTCFLHVGLHKTATTSFQTTCKDNLEVLISRGITYPAFNCPTAKLLKKKQFNHSISIFSLFCDNPSEYRLNKKMGVCENIQEVNDSYQKQLLMYLESSNNLIISGEDISMLSVESLHRLIQAIHNYGFEIKATALIRNPYSMLCSLLQQNIKAGKYYDLISLNDSAKDSSIDKIDGSARIVRKLKSVFREQISFYSFEGACSHKFGPQGFLIQEYLKLSPSDFRYVQKNKSLFNLTVRFQNELNKIIGEHDDEAPTYKYMPLPPQINENLSFSGKFLLTKFEFELAKEFIENQSAMLHDLTGLDELRNETIRFSDPLF